MSAARPSPTASVTPIDPGARPRLRPGAIVLRRSATELQVGLDVGNALRIPDPGGDLREVVRSLDGQRPWSAILDGLAGQAVDESQLSGVVRTLAAARHLELEHAEPGIEPLVEIRLVGTGELATGIGQQLVRGGIRRLHVVDDPSGSVETLRRRCEATARRVGRDDIVRIAQHWTKPESGRIALTVVAASTLEVDRGLVTDLLRRDTPHLIVRPTTTGAVVGPLVVPGRSSCVHCADLTRRDADPAWPELLRQLQHQRVPLTAAARAWATGIAVTQVLGFLGGGQPETLGATVELGAPTYAMRLRAWPAHPECGCRWDHVGWEPSVGEGPFTSLEARGS